MYRTALKKFSQSCKVWWFTGQFYLKQGDTKEARDLLKRSIQVLPKRKHIKTAVKFAQLEYKYGDSERGQTLMEGLVTQHPRRLDLWIVYLDKEIQVGDVKRIRRLFQRLATMKWSSKKAKFVFKKWLGWEKQFGDAEGVEEVKSQALAYVEANT